MSRWIVDALPAGVILLGLVIVVVGGAVLSQKYIRRRFPALSGEDHNDVIRFTYGFIGFVYAFFVGFVVSSMWGQISTADANARTEGAAAVEMARALHVFDRADSDRVRQALLDYSTAGIAEWDRAGDVSSVEADKALARLHTAYQQVQATTDIQKTYLATSNSNLDKMSQARTVRLLTARGDTGPPWPLWAVIFITSGMVLGAAIVYGVEKPVMHYPMVAIVGVIVASNLFLILELSHPYVGDIATSPDPLHEVVRVLGQPAP
ncbi:MULTISPECIES: bestrophin-like domain [Mycolicibacterium]|uniref:DUF4239 domain-containing protein n=1 Tax=Mycolicibacterium vanbaalenii (strain DSM 7251 / JCM 13017 / BCRC 16820 / KCTC 9966 / NRRL B-24157 / PYR-1) TaxID=350058 RepID=A1T658_MYCVP|nr:MULTISPECIES: DUF4239 domain-containing protein [Mycolicibacterium]ABM12658.1 conserved hypothetical protein [Mycolicibacterium vanbaalenii PYR-1]PQP40339.1 DUF4239 domain-containing protein [Mycolicibacterium austroafricanum]QZY47899.1 DUF4239 domain-containing protein [Mycolicibacterium austroafricanum]